MRLLRLAEVQHYIPYSRATIYRRISAGSFPSPINLGDDGRSVGWNSEEIEAYVAERVRERRPTLKKNGPTREEAATERAHTRPNSPLSELGAR
jgi:prophage regulatory protein